MGPRLLARRRPRLHRRLRRLHLGERPRLRDVEDGDQVGVDHGVAGGRDVSQSVFVQFEPGRLVYLSLLELFERSDGQK